MMRFEPHSHTHYSNLRLPDSINKPKDLIKRAIDIGLAGIAITDHECLSGSIELNKLQKEVQQEHPDFKIALGNEIYLVNTRETGQKYYHFILIAKDAIGHKQLRQLSSESWMNSYADSGERVPTLKSELRAVVMRNPGHLIATTACIGGELSSKTLEMENARSIKDTATAERLKAEIIEFVLDMKSLFGDDFYIECAPGCSREQIIVNRKLVDMAVAFGVKMVIGTDSHYLVKEDRYVHKAFLTSKDGDREVDAFYEYSYLQTEGEILNNLSASFANLEICYKMFNNSMEIWSKIENYSLLHSQQIPKVEVKNYEKKTVIPIDKEKFPILSSMYESDDKVERYWVNECINKLVELNKADSKYISRLEEEADIKRTIGEALDTNMFAYPVTLQHYVDLFWECGSTVGAGRGSSCSGLNHYLLGITQLDPLQWGFPFWRYLNKARKELGDIDIDLCPSKRPLILSKVKEERGQNILDYIAEKYRKQFGCTLVATFGTESTKSAILTACRGYRDVEYPDGIDVDTAQYLSSLVPQERGFLWELNDVINGNPSKDRKPVTTFINEVNQYPRLLEIMQGIEGLISRRGSHASGVILFDEDPYEFACFMRTPGGEVITQYDLHDSEAAGLTKYDFLTTDVQDKLTQTISYLQEFGEIPKELTLKEVYDKYFHPEALPIDDKPTWKAIQDVAVLNLFQFDSDVGSQAAKKIHPSTMQELSDSNGLMRLMTSEKGAETPMEKYIRFKNNINLWYQEMDSYGLTKEEQKTLEPHFLQSYGVPPSQEQMMTMLMDENICGFSLESANAARKIVGKKQMSKIPELHQQIIESARSPQLAKYVWDCGVGPQLGYSFSCIHALAYSFIGFQTAYIATHWNPIYWDTACLVVNSSSLEEEEEQKDSKKKEKGSDYAKVAKAIGDIRSHNIEVSLININSSEYGFRPDAENNRILFGLKALSNISSEVVEAIENNRPYVNLKDFMARCPVTKTVTLNLIKAGAFDELEEKNGFGSRKAAMVYYISQISEPKKRLTLQNFNGLIQNELVPKELEMQIRIFNFNKYLKAERKIGKYLTFNDICISFFNKFLSEEEDKLQIINGVTCILQTDWDKIYKKYMDAAREWLKEKQLPVLEEYNKKLFLAMWKKYASGTISHWEMESLCFYYHEHELANINMNKYAIVDFNTLSSEPEVDYFFKRRGAQIPIYKLRKIIGTVIAKNDSKSTVTLLTPTGVVNVKFTREYYAMFKRQISEVGADGSKHILERGWFSRGNMLMVTGFRRDDMFVGKTYKNTGSHQLYRITEVNGSDFKIQHERFTSFNTIEEDEVEIY